MWPYNSMKITKERLRAAKKRRREFLQAIKKDGIELEKQRRLTSDIRKQKREKLRERVLDQLRLEESVCDDYLKYLMKEDADSDYLTEVFNTKGGAEKHLKLEKRPC